MESGIEHKLDFDIIRARVADTCRSALGREHLCGLLPYERREDAEAELHAVTEMGRILSHESDLPLFGSIDGKTLERLSLPGSVLDPLQLKSLRRTLQNLRVIQAHFREDPPDDVECLASSIECLELPNLLLQELERTLDDDGMVRDDASPELTAARKRQQKLTHSIQSTLERLFRVEELGECFGDSYVTTINDRYVIPVLSDFKGRIDGVVQGGSRTGQSVFMEPMRVVGMNNDLLEAVAREHAEIARIVAALSDKARAHLDELSTIVSTLAWFDSLRARATFARQTRSIEPEFCDDETLVVIDGRHPLLGSECVPMSLSLEGHERVVVISGANSGGKTVALKTLGILSLLARRGYHIPCASGSRMPYFKQIFIEIGDQQSISENLSSFSSHSRNIGAILESASAGDLVLLDELMTGTDPEEGAALAETVLDDLANRGCVVIATTHYGQVKMLRQKSGLYKNAAVEFDRDSLRPTFRLMPDLPGASYGFEIASRFGMPANVVAAARELLGGGRNRLTELILDLEQELRGVRETARCRESELEEIERLREQLASKEKLFEKERRQSLDEELELGRAELLAFRKDMELRFSTLNEQLESVKAPRFDDEERRRVVRAIDEQLEQYQPVARKSPSVSDATGIEIGSRVKIPDAGVRGIVVRIDADRGTIKVDVNGIILALLLSDVVLSEMPSPRPHKGTSNIVTHSVSDTTSSLDIRGKRVHEAEEELERYIDRAIAKNLSQVTVIHGKGTGALKRFVETFLGEHPAVASFRRGREGEGDFGVTIVSLR